MLTFWKYGCIGLNCWSILKWNHIFWSNSSTQMFRNESFKIFTLENSRYFKGLRWFRMIYFAHLLDENMPSCIISCQGHNVLSRNDVPISHKLQFWWNGVGYLVAVLNFLFHLPVSTMDTLLLPRRSRNCHKIALYPSTKRCDHGISGDHLQYK